MRVDDSVLVCRMSAKALGRIGDVAAENLLREALKDEPDASVRDAIEKALREIEERGGVDSDDESGAEDGAEADE